MTILNFQKLVIYVKLTLYPKVLNFFWSECKDHNVVQISLLIITFLSLISWILSLMQTTKKVNPHPRIMPCVKMWSVTFLFSFFFLCHLLNVGACVRCIACEGQVEWTILVWLTGVRIQIVLTSPLYYFIMSHAYTNSIASGIHVNITKLRNITCTLVATGVILQSFECSSPTIH